MGDSAVSLHDLFLLNRLVNQTRQDPSAFHNIDGQPAGRGLLVFLAHVEPGLAHRFDAIIKRHEMAAIAAHSPAAAIAEAEPTSPWQPTSAPEIEALCLMMPPTAAALYELASRLNLPVLPRARRQ